MFPGFRKEKKTKAWTIKIFKIIKHKYIPF